MRAEGTVVELWMSVVSTSPRVQTGKPTRVGAFRTAALVTPQHLFSSPGPGERDSHQKPDHKNRRLRHGRHGRPGDGVRPTSLAEPSRSAGPAPRTHCSTSIVARLVERDGEMWSRRGIQMSRAGNDFMYLHLTPPTCCPHQPRFSRAAWRAPRKLPASAEMPHRPSPRGIAPY